MESTYDKSNYKPGFWALIATQAQGAFSDTLFRWVVVYLLISAAGANSIRSTGEITAIAGMLFAIPFFLFVGIFGAISDRFSKQRVTVALKYIEVFLMIAGGLALLTQNTTLLWVALFLMATQSAQFAPCKYALLPEGLPEERLSWGNGFLQGTTMIAIIAGTALAGPIFERLYPANATHWISVILVVLAVGGLIAARNIFKVPAANPSQVIPRNPYTGMLKTLKVFWNDSWLGLSVLAYTYFWFLAALIQHNLVPFGTVELGLPLAHVGYLMASLSIGIGLGCVAAGYLSRGKVEPGLIPIGALGLTVFGALLGFDWYSFSGCLFLLFGLGFFGGVFDVPLAAIIQKRSPAHMRGAVLMTANMLTWVGIFAASALYWVLSRYEISPYTIFLASAILSLGVGLYICIALPIFVLRSLLWLITNTLYRIRVIGRDNIPESGGALLVANHTSFLDALMIIVSIDRRVRFMMYKGIYDVPWIKPIAKMMGAIPVAAGSGPREVVQSLRMATESLKRGDLVCIFAEGQITRTGQMLPFRKGFERVMKGVDAPIIPVHIDQVWGTLFRFVDGRFVWKWPTRIPFTLTVGYGAPMPSDSNAHELRSAIQEMGTDAYTARDSNVALLHRQFIRKARRHPFALGIADVRSGSMSNIKTLAASIIFARKLGPNFTKDEEMVGLLLPQSVGGVLANVALSIMGKVPVNLNYTASANTIATSAHQCRMRHVITAKAFLEQVPIELPCEPIYVEDILDSVTTKDRLIAFLLAAFCPVKRLERLMGAPPNRTTDELATIVFSSGSEGEPKGIMLSHYNISKNIESALQVFPHKKGDGIIGMLPFFHSFGFTATLWLTLVTPHFRGIYHPNPMEPRAIGSLIQKYNGTILFSTSTFLHGFIRRCTPEQLKSVRHVITGAEKLAPRVRDAFKEKFGVEPLEGYGTTECSPIVSLNLPDVRAPGFFQKGTKRGSIGLPLPGISVRIIDPDTREILQNGAAGLLMVKGPNVMLGYLGKPEKTAEVLQDGWYETGDISTIDEDGFITITDRLARFSKLGGEMVSHTQIEEALHKLLDESERVLAIAGVPDEAKGERLVVLHTLSDEDFDLLISKLDETGLPNLWIPKSKAFYKVDEIPVLGTGKMDLKAVKTLARQLDIGE